MHANDCRFPIQNLNNSADNIRCPDRNRRHDKCAMAGQRVNCQLDQQQNEVKPGVLLQKFSQFFDFFRN